MAVGARNRCTASNNVNEHSSRSHLVLTVDITRPAGGGASGGGGAAGSAATPSGSAREPAALAGQLNLIDLAGSERLAKTGATGARLAEAKAINKARGDEGPERARRSRCPTPSIVAREGATDDGPRRCSRANVARPATHLPTPLTLCQRYSVLLL